MGNEARGTVFGGDKDEETKSLEHKGLRGSGVAQNGPNLIETAPV
jgi:hypothetical protein